MSFPTENWEAIVDRHGGPLIMLARQWTNCHGDAEDVVHEAFVRCWQRRESVREPIAYLYAAVREVARKWRRSETRRMKREQSVAAASVLLEPPDNPAVAAERNERREAIEAALTALPTEQREVLVMKIWGELTFAAIGEAVGVSPNTAAGRYRYALKGLSDRLKEQYNSDQSQAKH